MTITLIFVFIFSINFFGMTFNSYYQHIFLLIGSLISLVLSYEANEIPIV